MVLPCISRRFRQMRTDGSHCARLSPAVLSGKHLASEAETRICASALASANMLVGGRRFRRRNSDSRALKHAFQFCDTRIEIAFSAIFQRHVGGYLLGIA